ncbi:universal stress protein [Dactylosporangium sp. NPDC050588]|uniref:universal stress protein n=1 Tax=Dactylosporangium sp. NPDC050588 TaxID=3157211 RepID=UPI003409383B
MTSSDPLVIVGIDGSPAGVGAVRWAADEAVRLQRPLQITHALGASGRHEPTPEDLQPVVQAAAEAQSFQPGLHVITSTWQGEAAQILVEQSRHASLVVVGSRGPSDVEPLPADSLGVRLAVHAHCPVLVVPDAQRWADPAAVLPKHPPVLVGTDSSDNAQLAIELAFAEAASRHVDLIAVRAWQEPPRRWGFAASPGRFADLADRALAADVEPWRAEHPRVRVELRCLHGAPAPVLLAESRDALMVVLGPRGTGGSDELRLGSVTQQLLEHASAPVLVARR